MSFYGIIIIPFRRPTLEEILTRALDLLDFELQKKRLKIEIVICGAYAIHLLGYNRSEHTLDIDSLLELSSPEVIQIINDIGSRLSISSHWLNDQAASVPIPIGAISRASLIPKWTSIKAYITAREDLIKMKASAFSIRRDHTNKDWEDLLLLNPSQQEIDDAIAFVKEVNSPPPRVKQKLLKEFEETINDLKSLTK